MQTFERATFTTNRAMEFFTEKELQMRIGYSKHLWSVVLLKELIDNALDACENAGIQPAIEVRTYQEVEAVGTQHRPSNRGGKRAKRSKQH